MFLFWLLLDQERRYKDQTNTILKPRQRFIIRADGDWGRRMIGDATTKKAVFVWESKVVLVEFTCLEIELVCLLSCSFILLWYPACALDSIVMTLSRSTYNNCHLVAIMICNWSRICHIFELMYSVIYSEKGLAGSKTLSMYFWK